MTCQECHQEIYFKNRKFAALRTHTDELYFHKRFSGDCWDQFKARHPRLTVKKTHVPVKPVGVL
jgi:hypothetical protein